MVRCGSITCLQLLTIAGGEQNPKQCLVYLGDNLSHLITTSETLNLIEDNNDSH